MNPTFAAFVAEFRSNERLRWGVWAVVGILWLVGAMSLGDAAAREFQEHQALSRNVARMEALAAQSEWLTRVDEARAALEAAENRLWREQTPGLAQAAFVDAVNQAVRQSGLGRPQLTAGSQDESTPGILKLNVRLAFEFTPASLEAFLSRLAASERTIAIESITLRTNPSPRGEAALVGWYQRPGQAR